MSLPRSFVFASLAPIGAAALLLAACSGKVLSLGTNSTSSQLVSPSDISGTVTPCDTNAAHPNVCCSGGPGTPSSCVTYPDAPFTKCADGTTTYPDPRSCCPLDGSGNCAAPPPPPLDAGAGGGSSGGGSGGGCVIACPPGWYSPPNATGGECCQSDSNGSTACTASGSAGTGCACPACAPNEPCPPCDCPPPTPTPPACPACPPGWQVPQGDPDLCCTTDPNGVIECFSQAVPPPPPADDAGVPVPPTMQDAGTRTPMGCSGGGGGPDGAPGGCGCEEQTSGHTYAVNCDPGTNVCACTIDNGAPVSTFPDNGNTCSDYVALFTACGFPAP